MVDPHAPCSRYDLESKRKNVFQFRIITFSIFGVAPAAKFLSRIRILQLSTRKITRHQRTFRSMAQQAIVFCFVWSFFVLGGTNLGIELVELETALTTLTPRPELGTPTLFCCPILHLPSCGRERRCLRGKKYPQKSKEKNQWRTTDGRVPPGIVSPQYPS